MHYKKEITVRTRTSWATSIHRTDKDRAS